MLTNRRYAICGVMIGFMLAVTAACGGPPAWLYSPPTPTPHILLDDQTSLSISAMDDVDLLAGCIRGLKLAPIKDTSDWPPSAIHRYEWALDRAHIPDIQIPGALESIIYTDIESQEQTPEQIAWMRYLICPRFDDIGHTQSEGRGK